MIIRKARLKDIKEVAEMATALVNYHSRFDDYFAPSKNIKKEQEKYFKKFIKSSQNFILVAEEAGGIIGFVSAEIKKSPAIYKIRKTGTLEYMYIKEKFRKQGIGKMFLSEVLDWFKRKKIEYVIIAVHMQNYIGKNFWEKQGFTEFMSKQRVVIKS